MVAVGPATRFLQYMSLEPKVYEAVIQFGVTTDSYDADGAETSRVDVPKDLVALVESALPTFRGKINQIPPMFSAVKVQGKALYHYARQGEEIERKERSVFIERFDITWLDDSRASAHIVCSGGTYVRSLAHDLGQAVGCGAHLAALHRSQVGPYRTTASVALDDVTVEGLVPLMDALKPLPMALLNDAQIDHVRHGRAVVLKEEIGGKFIGLVAPDGIVVGVASVNCPSGD